MRTIKPQPGFSCSGFSVGRKSSGNFVGRSVTTDQKSEGSEYEIDSYASAIRRRVLQQKCDWVLNVTHLFTSTVRLAKKLKNKAIWSPPSEGSEKARNLAKISLTWFGKQIITLLYSIFILV